MIRVELPTGKTIFLSMEKYLELDDEGYQALIAADLGSFTEDPFSDFNHKSQNDDETDIEIEIEELSEEEIKRIKKEFDEDS